MERLKHRGLTKMYDWLPEVCNDIRQNLVGIYWLAIAPLVTFLIILQFFNIHDRAPNAMKVINRALLSILMLVSFEEVMHMISYVGDGVVHAISPKPHINDVLDEAWSFVQGMEINWLKYKETIIWIFSLVSFIFAYLGAFIADALVHFVWAILYVLSPLMILAYIPERTARVCTGLYQSLCTVMTWKIMWALLGVILLKFTTHAPIQDGDNYNAILLIVINLFIGTSLLFIPFTTKAFIGGDFSGYAAGLSMVPALAGKAAVVGKLKAAGGFAKNRAKKGLAYGASATGRSFRNMTSKMHHGPRARQENSSHQSYRQNSRNTYQTQKQSKGDK